MTLIAAGVGAVEDQTMTDGSGFPPHRVRRIKAPTLFKRGTLRREREKRFRVWSVPHRISSLGGDGRRELA